MEELYMVRLFNENKQLANVRIYENYEHALSDVIGGDPDLYEGHVEMDGVDFSKPQIRAESVDDSDYGVDFKFTYPSGVAAIIESVSPADRRFAK